MPPPVKSAQSSLTASTVAMFPTKQKPQTDPMINNLLLFADWRKLVDQLKPFTDKCVDYIAKGYIIDDLLDELLKGERGATKIVIMTKLNKNLIGPVIALLQSRYASPLTDDSKDLLLGFYQDAPAILDLINSAVGKEAVEEFATQHPSAALFC